MLGRLGDHAVVPPSKPSTPQYDHELSGTGRTAFAAIALAATAGHRHATAGFIVLTQRAAAACHALPRTHQPRRPARKGDTMPPRARTPAPGRNLYRPIVDEDPGEPVIRALAGTRLCVRETRLDVAGAARWLHSHGVIDAATITADLDDLSTLRVLCVRGDGWHLLPDIDDGRFFILETLGTTASRAPVSPQGCTAQREQDLEAGQ